MCRLRVKVRVTGKKNQEFIRFILVPKDRRQRSNYILSFGYWDTRKNSQIRFIVLNILKMMDYYYYGATFNKRTLCQFYNYLVDFHNLKTWVYFKQNQFVLFLENEIKKNIYKPDVTFFNKFLNCSPKDLKRGDYVNVTFITATDKRKGGVKFKASSEIVLIEKKHRRGNSMTLIASSFYKHEKVFFRYPINVLHMVRISFLKKAVKF